MHPRVAAISQVGVPVDDGLVEFEAVHLKLGGSGMKEAIIGRCVLSCSGPIDSWNHKGVN